MSKQPGDNFRVAVVLDTAGALAHLNQLQVTNPAAPYYVAPGTNHVPGFVGAVSPMLTVWRKLHLEFDSMTAPPASGAEVNWTSGKVIGAQPLILGPSRSRVTVRHARKERKAGLWQRGKLQIQFVGNYRIIGSSGIPAQNGDTITTLDVDGVVGANAVGRDASLFDDDDLYLTGDPLYPSILNLQSPPLPAFPEVAPFLSAARPRFDDAYITLANANVLGWNTQPTIPFLRNESAFLLTGPVAFDNGNLQLKGRDRPDFWAFSVVFGYQPGSDIAGVPGSFESLDDGDPNSETPLSGGTPKTGNNSSFGYCVIFLESIREHAYSERLDDGRYLPANFNDPNWVATLRDRYIESLQGTIAHEIGHAPGRQSGGTDHDELGIMTAGAPTISEAKFNPKTLGRFRQAASWTQ